MEVMLQMALRVSIVIIVVSALTYWHIYKTLVNSTIDGLKHYIHERGQRESVIFRLAESNHQIFKASFLAHWQQDFFIMIAFSGRSLKKGQTTRFIYKKKPTMAFLTRLA